MNLVGDECAKCGHSVRNKDLHPEGTKEICLRDLRKKCAITLNVLSMIAKITPEGVSLIPQKIVRKLLNIIEEVDNIEYKKGHF